MLDPKERAEARKELEAQGKLDALVKSMTLDELVPIVKVIVDLELAPFVTRETVRPTWEHQRRREYPIKSCVNYFEALPRAEKRKADMYPLIVIPLGSRDIITQKTNFDPMKANGHRNICFLPDVGEIKEFAIWGHHPGDNPDVEKPFTFFHRHRVMIEERPFTFTSGEKGVGRDIALIEESAPIDRQELTAHLLQHAIPEFDAVTKVYEYQPIVIRGRLMSFKSVEDWEPTGLLVEARDRDGKPIIDEVTKKTLMREERKPSAEGQPLIQPRLDDPNQEIYTFAASIVPMDQSEKPENRIKVKFLNKKLAQHFIDLGPIQEKLFRDAMLAVDDPTEDTWDVLDGFLRGTEVLVVGVVTRFQKDPKGRPLNWVDIEATMLLSLEATSEGADTVEQVVTTQPTPAAAPSPSPSPTPDPAPVAEPEIIQPITPVAPEPEKPPERAVEPSIHDVVVTAETVPAPPVAEVLTPVQKLMRVVEEAVEVWQTYNLDISEIEMVQSPLMTEFCIPGTATIKEEHHDKVRLAIKKYKEAHKGETLTAPPIATAPGPATGQKGESFEGVTFTKEPDTEPAAGTTGPPIVEDASKPAVTDASTTYTCPACKATMSQDEVFEHWNVCPAKGQG